MALSVEVAGGPGVDSARQYTSVAGDLQGFLMSRKQRQLLPLRSLVGYSTSSDMYWVKENDVYLTGVTELRNCARTFL